MPPCGTWSKGHIGGENNSDWAMGGSCWKQRGQLNADEAKHRVNIKTVENPEDLSNQLSATIVKMPISHVIIWAGNYGQNTYFHGDISAEQAASQFDAKPVEQQGASFFTPMPAFQVLNKFSQIGYSVLGMSGNGACQTSWVMGKQQDQQE